MCFVFCFAFKKQNYSCQWKKLLKAARPSKQLPHPDSLLLWWEVWKGWGTVPRGDRKPGWTVIIYQGRLQFYQRESNVLTSVVGALAAVQTWRLTQEIKRVRRMKNLGTKTEPGFPSCHVALEKLGPSRIPDHLFISHSSNINWGKFQNRWRSVILWRGKEAIMTLSEPFDFWVGWSGYVLNWKGKVEPDKPRHCTQVSLSVRTKALGWITSCMSCPRCWFAFVFRWLQFIYLILSFCLRTWLLWTPPVHSFQLLLWSLKSLSTHFSENMIFCGP